MKHKIITIIMACLLFGCDTSESIVVLEEQLSLKIIVLTYNYCDENWENNTSTLIVENDGLEVINQELLEGVNSITLPSGYSGFDLTITKKGTEETTFYKTKEEIKTFQNAPLEVKLATKIYEGNLIIDTLEKYTNFSTDNYGRVNGNLAIVGIDNLTNMNDLLSLTSIQGGLRIIDLKTVQSLAGMDNIKCIGGDVSIYKNSLLSNIESLMNLSSIGDYLWIQDNSALQNLEGLNNITSLSSYLQILSNSSLTSLSGIDNINSIQGDIEIMDNDVLIDIKAFYGLTTVNQDLRISGNFNLVNLTGLNDITSISNTLTISENKITSLEGLNNLILIGGNLNIYNNSLLYNWCPIQNLLQNNGLNGGHLFGNCSYNPSIQDIINGNCSS